MQVVNEKIDWLAEDPETRGRRAPSPPFSYFGHVFHFNLEDGKTYYATGYFYFGDNKKSIVIDLIRLLPKYEPRKGVAT